MDSYEKLANAIVQQAVKELISLPKISMNIRI